MKTVTNLCCDFVLWSQTNKDPDPGQLLCILALFRAGLGQAEWGYAPERVAFERAVDVARGGNIELLVSLTKAYVMSMYSPYGHSYWHNQTVSEFEYQRRLGMLHCELENRYWRQVGVALELPKSSWSVSARPTPDGWWEAYEEEAQRHYED